MIPRFTMVVTAHLLLIKDEQILLSRRFQTGYEDGNYSLPAGHVDADESCLQAMIREAKEEIGLDLQAENLNFSHVMHRFEGREAIDFFFSCEKWRGEAKNMEPDKCDDLAWFPIQNLPEHTIPYIKQAVNLHLQGKAYSERGFAA